MSDVNKDLDNQQDALPEEDQNAEDQSSSQEQQAPDVPKIKEGLEQELEDQKRRNQGLQRKVTEQKQELESDKSFSIEELDSIVAKTVEERLKEEIPKALQSDETLSKVAGDVSRREAEGIQSFVNEFPDAITEQGDLPDDIKKAFSNIITASPETDVKEALTTAYSVARKEDYRKRISDPSFSSSQISKQAMSTSGPNDAPQEAKGSFNSVEESMMKGLGVDKENVVKRLQR